MKLFEFDSNVFFHFKDHLLKVLAIDVVADVLPLMFNQDGEPHFLYYRQSDPTRFKSFDEDLLTLMERVDKAILEQLDLVAKFIYLICVFVYSVESNKVCFKPYKRKHSLCSVADGKAGSLLVLLDVSCHLYIVFLQKHYLLL